MNATIKEENGKIIITLEGRLDTTNAQEFGNQISPLLTLASPDIILECQAFNYISSSGLRVLLSLQKSVIANKGRLVLRNIQPEIREVFDMTGFTSVFTIE